MIRYESNSPWFDTRVQGDLYLDILKIRPVPANDDDILYEVQPQYAYRPDLLSYDLYGTKNLWWVFAQRNMEVLKDPVNDLLPGLKIYLPKGDALARQLGV
jgi:hypothetical protein|tara:strand:- start:1811 stop:2113 length:303 start_codon:yes stop_codon:yes gene_type:complete